jgi:hypothetical protein
MLPQSDSKAQRTNRTAPDYKMLHANLKTIHVPALNPATPSRHFRLPKLLFWKY